MCASNARLSIPCELLHELLPRKKDSAFDRADSQVEPFGDFSVLVSLCVHGKRDSEIIRERIDGLFYLREFEMGVGGYIVRPIHQDALALGVVEHCVFPREVTVVVNVGIAHDSEGPRPHVGVFLERLFEGQSL